MMGDSGLRITEATLAQRERLRYVPTDGDVPAGWSLQIVGKGRKQRSVPVSAACVAALRAHWADRELDFDAPPETAPLIKPTDIPPTPAAQRLHGNELGAAGYSANGLRGLVNWAFAELGERLALTDDARQHLASATPHALRHTFGTQAIAANVPPDVAQKVLGHASFATTSIYAQAETKRVRSELAGYFAQMQALDVPILLAAATEVMAVSDTVTVVEPRGAADAKPLQGTSKQLAHVRVTLQVRASTVRRAERARDALERWILALADIRPLSNPVSCCWRSATTRCRCSTGGSNAGLTTSRTRPKTATSPVRSTPTGAIGAGRIRVSTMHAHTWSRLTRSARQGRS
ncbi:MAG: site-specific integrase [Burkholderia sp.]